MKRKIETTKMFALLRQLPPEVSFLKVEQWVKTHTIAPPKPNNWLTNWLTNWLMNWRNFN